MDPLLVDLPERAESSRLMMRIPQHGDGAIVNRAITESFEFFKPWFAWCQKIPTVEASERFQREQRIKFYQRTGIPFLLFEKATGDFVGTVDVHMVKWDIGQFELGAWCTKSKEGSGYMLEAGSVFLRMFDERGLIQRATILSQVGNKRSIALARSLNFTEEGILKKFRPGADGKPADFHMFAKIF